MVDQCQKTPAPIAVGTVTTDGCVSWEERRVNSRCKLSFLNTNDFATSCHQEIGKFSCRVPKTIAVPRHDADGRRRRRMTRARIRMDAADEEKEEKS